MSTSLTALDGLGLAGFLAVSGSAVAGLLISGLFEGRVGRTGAEDKEPTMDIAVAGLTTCGTEVDLAGEAEGSADPGRSGTFLPAILARFCAAIVSLIDGFEGTEFKLREKWWSLEAFDVADELKSL